jgi:hypothetical protein
MTVARHVRIQGSFLISRESLGWQTGGPDFKGALTLAGSEINGSLYMSTASRGGFDAKGPISLRSTSCKQLFVHEEVLHHDIDLEGLTYTRLRGVTPVQLLNKLRKYPSPCPQAHVQLAHYCQTIGEIKTRKEVLIALEKSLTRALPFLSLTRFLRSLHGLFVGYGYRAARAIPWLILSIILSSWLIHTHGGLLISKASPGGQISAQAANFSWFESFRFAVDNFLPFASLGVKESWTIKASSLSESVWF